MKKLITIIIMCLFVITTQGQKFKAHSVGSTLQRTVDPTDTASISITLTKITVGKKSYKIVPEGRVNLKDKSIFICDEGDVIIYYMQAGSKKAIDIRTQMATERQVYVEDAILTPAQVNQKKVYDSRLKKDKLYERKN